MISLSTLTEICGILDFIVPIIKSIIEKNKKRKRINKMINYYTGIGSRETPLDYYSKFEDIAIKLAVKNYTLRSGHANGADSYFEVGTDFANGNKEIYLPWTNFNSSDSDLVLEDPIPHDVEILCKEIYYSWDYVKPAIKKFHARNVYQILGKTLDNPSSFVVCWTDRKDSDCGGTQFGIHLAHKFNIPVYNFYYPLQEIEFDSLLSKGVY